MLNLPTNSLYKRELQRIKEEKTQLEAIKAHLLTKALKPKTSRLHTQTKWSQYTRTKLSKY